MVSSLELLPHLRVGDVPNPGNVLIAPYHLQSRHVTHGDYFRHLYEDDILSSLPCVPESVDLIDSEFQDVVEQISWTIYLACPSDDSVRAIRQRASAFGAVS